jgi:formylglycine-generating enzyme required for sulfatase activity
VLEGEFFLDSQSGKYNITYWDLVPEWLGEQQFLFYTGTDLFGRFQQAIEMFERNWPRDIFAQRPLNPDNKSVHGSNHALYDAACDYAERLAFEDARKHFNALVRRNDRDYAAVAAQWLELLGLYAELIEIDGRRSARFIFNTKWSAYQALFPKDFWDGLFDPKGFNGRNEQPVAPAPVRPAPTPTRPTSQSLMPRPFDWIEIPGGSGTMATNDERIILDIPTQTYWISKYPITNAQYAKFIDADGYNQQKWWTAAGWEAKAKGWGWNKKGKWGETGKAWTEPEFWTDSKWNGADQPVVGVSWYESVAFCLWLSDVTGEKIMLPTEDQWQYAAQGKDGRWYPWGNDWDSSRLNSTRSGIGKTTPVTQFEGRGDSPFGVVDMVGNVREYCLTDDDARTNDPNSAAYRRVQRGGDWYFNPYFACAVYHDRCLLDSRSKSSGFRVVRAT